MNSMGMRVQHSMVLGQLVHPLLEHLGHVGDVISLASDLLIYFREPLELDSL